METLCLNFQKERIPRFKSYYVVWKQHGNGGDGSGCAGLNRTM